MISTNNRHNTVLTRLSVITLVAGFLLQSILMQTADAAKTSRYSKTVGRTYSASQRVSLDQINHQSWDTLLKKYVNDAGQVNYQAWQKSAVDRTALRQYLEHLSRGDRTKTATRNARLAFWINAYNAVTIEGILREFPTTSIRNHTGITGYNIWHHLLLPVGNEKYSLDEIEHQILRKMNEPRIHFAIVCASIGCPRLLNEAYTAKELDKQLETNAKHFFAQEQNFEYDTRRNRFYMSSILKWFGKDFGSSQSERLKTIAPWLPSQQAQTAALQNRVRLTYLEYDWNLNAQ